jgi:hypothetical protein
LDKAKQEPETEQETGQATDEGRPEACSSCGRPGVWIALVLGAIIVCAFILWNAQGKKVSDRPGSGPARQSADTTPAATPLPATPDRLVGVWVRADYPYMIAIRQIRSDGTLDAAYRNPKPINVHRAEVRDKKGKTEVYLELRDVNYPGSYYTLTYDSGKDVLRGIYYQAVLKQSFDVAFRRMTRR